MRAAGLTPGARAAVIASPPDRLEFLKDSQFFYEPEGGTIAPGAEGRLCVLELAGPGALPIVGIYTRHDAHRVDIRVFFTNETMKSDQLVGAWRIRWWRSPS